MMRFILYLLLLVSPFHNSFPMFSRVEGIEDAQIKRVVVSPLNPKLVYTASDKALFKSQDSAQTFEKVYGVKDEVVQHIFFDAHLADVLYVAASRHVFRVANGVEKIFSAPEEAEILTAAEFEGKIYVGTTAGIYFAGQDTLNWGRISNFRNDVSVYSIASSPQAVYITSSKGIYRLEGKDKVTRVFIVKNSDVEEELGLVAMIIKVDIFDKNKIWAGTNQGVFVSLDKGNRWNKLYIEGIDNLYINSLAQKAAEPEALYLASSQGFFRVDLNQKTSQNVSGGIYSSEINWVEVDLAGRIYLAASRGMFVSMDSFGKDAPQISAWEELLKNEPAIEEVQQAALRYNEVGADKIKKWRRGLKTRALFPQVSLDYDKTVTTALGATYDRVQVGPQDWGVNLKWDVGDLVWNTYEDDVDTRSRLNTQLRLDILDEINRVYFERLRLKGEIKAAALSDEQLFQKQLRLKELDAIIDGYTGGHFSKRMKK